MLCAGRRGSRETLAEQDSTSLQSCRQRRRAGRCEWQSWDSVRDPRELALHVGESDCAWQLAKCVKPPPRPTHPPTQKWTRTYLLHGHPARSIALSDPIFSVQGSFAAPFRPTGANCSQIEELGCAFDFRTSPAACFGTLWGSTRTW